LKIVLTFCSIVIPIAIAFWVINSNLVIQNKNAESEHLLAEEVAKYDFKLKAAEIVMNSRSVNETEDRAKALTVLFPEYLDKNFSTSLEQFGLGNNTYGRGLLIYPKNGNIYFVADGKSTFSVSYQKGAGAWLSLTVKDGAVNGLVNGENQASKVES